MKKITYIILICLFLPICICAESNNIEYKDASIKFSVDSTYWVEGELSKERIFIDKIWNSDCGSLTSGATDIYDSVSDEIIDTIPSSELNGYSDSEKEEIIRKYLNYNYIFLDEIDNNWVQSDETTTINSVKYVTKNGVKFIKANTTTKYDDYDISGEQYITIINGYYFLIQFFSLEGVNENTCNQTLDDIISTIELTSKVYSQEEEDLDYSVLNLLINLSLTIILYLAYPFIQVKIRKKKYDKKSCKKMAMWNSIIVGAFCMIITIGNGSAWHAGPAFLYYLINSSIWFDKKNKKKSNDLSVKVENEEDTEKSNNTDKLESDSPFTCPERNSPVKENQKKCKKCGCELEWHDDNASDANKISVEEEIIVYTCPDCNSPIKENQKKCKKCGCEFEWNDNITEEKYNNKSNNKIYCPKCGNKINKDDSFCRNCGNDISKMFEFHCPKCNSLIEKKDDFCGKCGCEIDWSDER